MNCMTCGGLIMEPGKVYHYAGPVCHCALSGVPIQRRPDQQGDYSGISLPLGEADKEIEDLRAQLAEKDRIIADLKMPDRGAYIAKLSEDAISSQMTANAFKAQLAERDREIERLKSCVDDHHMELQELFGRIAALQSRHDRLSLEVEKRANMQCSFYTAHPQSIWYNEHVQRPLRQALSKDKADEVSGG